MMNDTHSHSQTPHPSHDPQRSQPSARVPEECSPLVEAIEEFVIEARAGRPSSETRDVLQRSVEDCPECVETLGIEEEIRALLRMCCCEPAPVELRARITRQLRVTYRITGQ